jgi:class 3 adenylate cyclase
MTQEGFKRKLTSIFSADAVGYSRLMGDDEAATVRTLTSYRDVIFTLIKQHNGTVIDSPGDNLLAEFVSVVDAVQCAVAVQKELKARNEEFPENRRMQFRIGINLGDVIHEDDRIYGDGVNIAARLEGLAEPGGICISKTAFEHIESKLPYGYEFLGDQTVKNITKPVGAYRVQMEPRVTVVGEAEEKKPEPSRRKAIFVGAFAVLILVAGRHDEAIPEYKKAIRLNPIPPTNYLFGLGLSYCWTGQYEEAIKWCEKAVRQDPDSFLTRLMMTVVYSSSGREEDARAEATEVLRINPKFSVKKWGKTATGPDTEKFLAALRKAGLK